MNISQSSHQIETLASQLRRWLIDDAYSLWSKEGFDRHTGGFQEELTLDAQSTKSPRRIRVQARQVYAFAQAPRLGWTGDASKLVEYGLDYIRKYYRRDDGLYRQSITPNGEPLDNRAYLYDQAFVLLALAEAEQTLGRRPTLRNAGRELRDAIFLHLKRQGPGFMPEETQPDQLLSNPHMHLFEAAQSWLHISDDPEWADLADYLGDFALRRLIDPNHGFIREYYDEECHPADGLNGRIIEPGHQFEWAWLLLKWSSGKALAREAAARLIEIGLTKGVHDGFAINALLDDYSVHNGAARLWPQTEWLKAMVAITMSGGNKDEQSLVAAATALLAYFDLPLRGLWRDCRQPNGEFVIQNVPASSFYHIVMAISELNRLDQTT